MLKENLLSTLDLLPHNNARIEELLRYESKMLKLSMFFKPRCTHCKNIITPKKMMSS